MPAPPPKTFLIGFTEIDMEGLTAYLEYTGQTEFLEHVAEAKKHGISGGEIICSFYAKLCYKSLVEGKNSNISRVRGIADNFLGCLDQKHGAVFEHCGINFVTTGCSRVFTHELVRHRVGTAYSQTSGRYCTPEEAKLVLPECFDEEDQGTLNSALGNTLSVMKYIRDKHDVDSMPMKQKKEWTSALRRPLPVGCDNEIGFTLNIRSVRHLIEMRTNRHAEWEIRHVFNEVADIINDRFPLMLSRSMKTIEDGLGEYTGLRV